MVFYVHKFVLFSFSVSHFAQRQRSLQRTSEEDFERSSVEMLNFGDDMDRESMDDQATEDMSGDDMERAAKKLRPNQ